VCIFLNFESVLNYEPRARWGPQPPNPKIETRISSMFNPKHTEPNAANSTEQNQNQNRSQNQRTKNRNRNGEQIGLELGVRCFGVGGSGLKVFHRKSSETQPNSTHTICSTHFFQPLLSCVRNRNPKN